MANFPTHITTAGLLGATYGAVGHLAYGMPLQSSILAGGLCAVAGVLPDVDSDNAVILRESLSIVALLTPLLFLDRFQEMGWTTETIVLSVSLGYIIIRFGVGEIIRRLTIHRGMWHSIPAALTTGMVIYCICDCADESIRIFKAGATVSGFLWHLLLDEIYSVERHGVGFRVKKSFGTALKFFSTKPAANLVTYGLMLSLAAFIVTNPLGKSDGAHYSHQQDGAGQPTDPLGQPPYPAGQPAVFPEDRYRQPQPVPQPWNRVSSPPSWAPVR